MSWMSPSYVLQSEFNASWTPLASRYSLLLYREVGWEPTQVRARVGRGSSSTLIANEMGIADGFARPVHTRECGIITPSALNSVICR